jgi:hypothetical protein
MGCILVPLYKRGKEEISSSYKSLHDIPVTDIDDNKLERLGTVTEDKKCIMVVNVASK